MRWGVIDSVLGVIGETVNLHFTNDLCDVLSVRNSSNVPEFWISGNQARLKKCLRLIEFGELSHQILVSTKF